MKTLILLSLILVCAIQSFAQGPPAIRRPAPTPTPPPVRKLTPEQEQAKIDTEMVKRQGYFKTGTSFEKDKRYYSEDNRYAMVFQSDGNLVVYKFAAKESYKAIWNSGTVGRAVKTCVFQHDGNLVMYDYAGKAIWDSNTDAKNREGKGFGFKADRFFPAGGGNWMVMQSDGNLVVYGNSYPSTGYPRWSSNSFEKN